MLKKSTWGGSVQFEVMNRCSPPAAAAMCSLYFPSNQHDLAAKPEDGEEKKHRVKLRRRFVKMGLKVRRCGQASLSCKPCKSNPLRSLLEGSCWVGCRPKRGQHGGKRNPSTGSCVGYLGPTRGTSLNSTRGVGEGES